MLQIALPAPQLRAGRVQKRFGRHRTNIVTKQAAITGLAQPIFAFTLFIHPTDWKFSHRSNRFEHNRAIAHPWANRLPTLGVQCVQQTLEIVGLKDNGICI